MSATIKWDGARELIKDLTKASKYAQLKSQKVIKNNTEELKRNVISLAPYDTGFLKGSVIATYPNPFWGVVDVQAMYAPFVEYGTRFMEEQPYMKPSFWVQYPKFIKDMEDVLKGAFK